MSQQLIIGKKKEFLYSSINSDDYNSKFFFKSILHHVVCMEIYENNFIKGISFENICSNVPKIIGSRSSIQSILNEGLHRNLYFKEQSDLDKRIKNYFLSKDFLLAINKWLDDEKSIFDELKK